MTAEPGPSTVSTERIGPRDMLAVAWLGAQRSVNTATAYRTDLREYFMWCDERGLDVLSARRPTIDGFRQWLLSEDRPRGRVADSTLARKLTTLSSYYTYCSQEAPQLVQRNPVDRVKRPELADVSMTEGLTLDEARGVLRAAAELGPMEHALLQLLLTTGMRVSEACGANTWDLGRDADVRTITVRRKGGRTQKLKLAPAVAEAIDVYLRGRSGPLFMSARTRLNRRQALRIVERLAGQVVTDKDISPHSLRHTAATIALTAGESLRNVQRQLGHRDPRTTNRYDQARFELANPAADTLAALLDTSGGAL